MEFCALTSVSSQLPVLTFGRPLSGSGVGMGVGIDLSPPPAAEVETELNLSIRDRVTGQVLWEGRASFTVRSTSPLADTGLAAPKMAEALFAGFPGKSGETIEVR